jgi:hypothetical protein
VWPKQHGLNGCILRPVIWRRNNQTLQAQSTGTLRSVQKKSDIVRHFVPLIVSLLKLIENRSSKVSSPQSLVNVRKSPVRERQAWSGGSLIVSFEIAV